MTSKTKTLRRRLHHGDIDGKMREEHFDTSDALTEPLLANDDDDDDNNYNRNHTNNTSSAAELTLEDIWGYGAEEGANPLDTFVFTVYCAVGAMVSQCCGSFWIRRFFPLFSSSAAQSNNRCILPQTLSPLQEERLINLQQRLGVPFDGSRLEHQDALKQLWRLAYPDRELPSLKSELWKEMGWQGSEPSTDFWGGGFVSLENLFFFAKKCPCKENNAVCNCSFHATPVICREWKTYFKRIYHHLKDSFQRLLNKKDRNRAEWGYPFAVAGINISFMLAQMLDLQKGKPSTMAGIRFLEQLAEDEMSFDNLYCIAFQMMDTQWLAKRASYMEFNDVLKSTRMQLERELALGRHIV